MLKAAELKINYSRNPAGITAPPQFSWIIESDRQGILQKSYHLQIAVDQSFDAVIFDSQVKESGQSAHICADGLVLKSACTYFVRVKITDTKGQVSDWSRPAHFITGLLHPDEWTAQFISAETIAEKDSTRGHYLRKSIHLDKPVQSAYAYTTALGLYHFHINGRKVGKDQLAPGWTSYLKHLLYQTYDISGLLNEGDNALGAITGAGWYKGPMGFLGNHNNYGLQTAFLCQIHIQYTDGTSEIIGSDLSWKAAPSPVIMSEIYNGETYDARLEQDGWNTPDFDDRCWTAVFPVDFDFSVLTAQDGCRIRKIDRLTAKEIITTPEGDTVIDFGQNLTGWVQLKAAAKKDAVIEINCFETLDAKGNVYLDNLRGAKQTLSYTFKDDQNMTYEPHFTFQGFRYAKISQFPGQPQLENFTAYSVHSDMEPTGSFKCSNPDLNQLHHNITWGMKGNFLDVPTDCPQRNERLGWTGDAQIFCQTSAYLMNVYTFFSKWLKDVAADQTPEGGIPHVIPDIITQAKGDDWLISQGTHSAAAWADAAVINPWVLYQTYGDTVIIEKQYESMKSWIEFMRAHANDHIWTYRLQFGDWVALDAEEGSYFGATPTDLTCTAYYAYSTRLFAQMAKAIDRKKDYEEYRQLADDVKDSFIRHYFDDNGRLTARTQTAHIVALHFDLTPDAYKEKTIQGLLELLDKENGHLVTGFIGTPYFCHALSDNGHTKEAYDLLLKDDFPSWLYQVKMGATTVWEHWDGLKPDGTMWSADMNSFNHYAYGAVGEWLYKVCAGIKTDPESPGYKHSIIHPKIGGNLDFVDASFMSIYGPVSSKWEISGTEVTLTIIIPPNTTADIYMDHAENIIFNQPVSLKKTDSGSIASVHSGKHIFRYTLTVTQ